MSSNSKNNIIKPGEIVMSYMDLIYRQFGVGDPVRLSDLRNTRRVHVVEFTSPALTGATNGGVRDRNRFIAMLYNPSPDSEYVIICVHRSSAINKRWNFTENKFFKMSKAEAVTLANNGDLRYANTEANIEQFDIFQIMHNVSGNDLVSNYRLHTSIVPSIDAFNAIINSTEYKATGGMRFSIVRSPGNPLGNEPYINILLTYRINSNVIDTKFIFEVDRIMFTTKYDIIDAKQRKAIVKDVEALGIKAKGSPLTKNKKYKVLEVIQKSTTDSGDDILIVAESDSKVMKTHTVQAKLLKYAED